jgi:hypothetical protein
MADGSTDVSIDVSIDVSTSGKQILASFSLEDMAFDKCYVDYLSMPTTYEVDAKGVVVLRDSVESTRYFIDSKVPAWVITKTTPSRVETVVCSAFKGPITAEEIDPFIKIHNALTLSYETIGFSLMMLKETVGRANTTCRRKIEEEHERNKQLFIELNRMMEDWPEMLATYNFLLDRIFSVIPHCPEGCKCVKRCQTKTICLYRILLACSTMMESE